MDIDISGLDKMMLDLNEAKEALASIEGELGNVNFNPHDPASIEAAIQGAENIIDERLGCYATNPFVAPIVEAMKEQFRAEIIERASAVRLDKEQNEQEQ